MIADFILQARESHAQMMAQSAEGVNGRSAAAVRQARYRQRLKEQAPARKPQNLTAEETQITPATPCVTPVTDHVTSVTRDVTSVTEAVTNVTNHVTNVTCHGDLSSKTRT
ncbi:hypothetical protein, partial [Brevifollis gellanilyticus]|uniref:hypothetical protein n=1 Tax=Brevifollis gellanilyticus TaxID=748831 RepID=UPI001C3F62C2